MALSPRRLVLIFMVLGLSACGNPGSNEAGAASATPPSDFARFNSEMSDKGCELLSAQLVSATLDVPADILTQRKIMGCRYDGRNGDETVEAGISMIRVYDSEAAAANWFASATQNRTAEEMAAEMEKVSGQLDQAKELDTDLKKSTAKNLLATVDSTAINFEDVAGVGDEARVSSEGTVYVRVDNLTFMVSAYKGPVAPRPDIKSTDMKQITAAVNKTKAEWASKTLPARKKDGTLLAKAIVAEL